MPLYEYQCEKCQHHEEVIQKFSDLPLNTCPKCQGPFKKLMSLNSFHLKGSGWYSTDYKKPSPGGTEGTKKGSGGDSSGSGT